MSDSGIGDSGNLVQEMTNNLLSAQRERREAVNAAESLVHLIRLSQSGAPLDTYENAALDALGGKPMHENASDEYKRGHAYGERLSSVYCLKWVGDPRTRS